MSLVLILSNELFKIFYLTMTFALEFQFETATRLQELAPSTLLTLEFHSADNGTGDRSASGSADVVGDRGDRERRHLLSPEGVRIKILY